MRISYTAAGLLLASTVRASAVPRHVGVPLINVPDAPQGPQTDGISSIDGLARRGLLSCFRPAPGADEQCDVPAGPQGLHIDEKTCTGDRLDFVKGAVNGIRDLAQIGQQAILPASIEQDNNPFFYFFRGEPPYSTREQYAKVINYVGGRHYSFAGPIRISCSDEFKKCGARGPMSYVHQERDNAIILCDSYFLLPLPSEPCAESLALNGFNGIGGTTRDTVLLHEFYRAESRGVTGGLTNLEYGTEGCIKLAWEGDPARPYVRHPEYRNIDTYVWAASWARDMIRKTGNHYDECFDRFAEVAQDLRGKLRAGEYPSIEDLQRFHSGSWPSSDSLEEKRNSDHGSPKQWGIDWDERFDDIEFPKTRKRRSSPSSADRPG